MSRIIATGHYVPQHCYSNDRLIQQYALESSHDWIAQRTGIFQRYLALEEEVVDLAIQAAKAILSQVDDDVIGKIRQVVVATMSDSPTPSIATQVQSAIGAKNAWGFDLNGACSGFVMALHVANQLSQSLQDGYTLVIGADKMSNLVDYHDRTTAVLFGDGAGAILIQHDGKALLESCSQLYTKTDKQEAITFTNDTHLQMNGRDVFNFVKREVISTLVQFIDTHHIQSFDYLICHQANQRLLDLFGQKLGIPTEKVASNISQVGNTSSASIPILLDQLVQQEHIFLNGTQSIILSGFGGGLSWGHIYIKI